MKPSSRPNNRNHLNQAAVQDSTRKILAELNVGLRKEN